MSEPPSEDGRPARSDAASRLAALLADVVDAPAPAPDESDPAPRRPGARAPRPRPRPSGGAEAPEADLASVIAGGTAAPSAPATPDATPAGTTDADGEATAPVAVTPAPPAPTAPIPGPPPAPTSRKDAAPRTDAAPAPAPRRTRAPLAKGEPTASAPSPGPAPASAPRRPRPDAPRAGAAWADANVAASARAEEEAAATERAKAARRAPRLTLRAVAFGIAFALLVAAVPALGWVGKERLLDSKAGTFVEGTSDPTEAGFLAAVNPTPTALVVHRDDEGTPTSAAVLSLGAGEEGGTVLLIPLSLEPADSTYFQTIIAGYERVGNDDGFRRSIEDVIEVSVPPPVIDVTDESLATLVAPVAPLELDVTDPVQLEDGTALTGPVELTAEQVGPYLRASREGEPEIARLERARDLWTAWLDAIGSATTSEPIGAAATGIGFYLRALAGGTAVVEALDVVAGDTVYGQEPYLEPGPGMVEQVIDAVPFPQSPRPGTRFNIELVNGAEGATLPMSLMRELVLAGGSLAFLGNAEEFGQEDTLVEYNGPEWRDTAEVVAEMLGPSASVEEIPARRAESETEDLVITIGSEVLSAYEEDDGG